MDCCDDHYSVSIDVMGCASSKEVGFIGFAHLQLPVVTGGEDLVAPDVVVAQPMKENTKLTISDFELLKTIGQGSFGKVFQV